MLNVAVVGAGRRGANHIRVLWGLDGIDLVATLEPAGADPDRAHGVPIVAEVDALRDVDCVVVALPTGTHEAIAIHLVDHCFHVLIKKPLAATSASAQRIRRAAARNNVVAGVGHFGRVIPALREAHRRIHAGELGRVLQVATKCLSQRPVRVTNVIVGMDLTSHSVDLAAWLFLSSYASNEAQVRARPASTSEDLISAVGVLVNGTVANHVVNWVSPPKRRPVVVSGERGALVVDTLREDLALHSNAAYDRLCEGLANMHGTQAGDVTHFAFPTPEPLVVEHEVFRDAVLGQTGQIASLSDGAVPDEVVESVLGAVSG